MTYFISILLGLQNSLLIALMNYNYNSRCGKCPSIEKLRDYLYSSLEHLEGTEIVYQQWTGTDRTTLISDSTTLHHLIDMTVRSIDALTSHSFTAKAQSRYLKMRKENLDDNSIRSIQLYDNHTLLIPH